MKSVFLAYAAAALIAPLDVKISQAQIPPEFTPALPRSTVAGLPSCIAGRKGQQRLMSDGGAEGRVVRCDGGEWKCPEDNVSQGHH